jgi:hypothetical protein
MPQRFYILLPRLAVALAAALLLWAQARAALLLLQSDWMGITFPYPLDYGEGPLLDQALRLARFENIYHRDLMVPPYTLANYPPLFSLAQAPFVWAFGPAFWYGRALSALSVLAAALFIGLTLHALTRDWLAALVGGLTLLAFPYILHWSPLNRVDSLALGLSWAGLFVVARWPDRRWGIVGAALLLTAAIATRQSTALAAPLAAFVWLLYAQPRRRAFVFGALLGGVCLLLLLLLNALTHGGFFLNVVVANVNPFVWGEVRRRMDEIVGYMPYLLIGSALFVVAALPARVRSWWLTAPYLVGATLSAITVGKVGSNVNYLYELMAAFSVVAGALVAWAANRPWLRALALLLLAAQVATLTAWSREEYEPYIRDRVAQQPEIEQLARLVRGANGPVLIDEYMGLVPLAGRSIYFQPFEFKQLADAGLWDEHLLAQAVERQEFALILLYEAPEWRSLESRWTPTLRGRIYRRYDRGEVWAHTVVYRPKP